MHGSKWRSHVNNKVHNKNNVPNINRSFEYFKKIISSFIDAQSSSKSCEKMI